MRTKDFDAAIQEALEDLTRPENMKRYGEEAARIIRVRTRLGYGVREDGGEKEKLLALSDEYIEQREMDKETGNLSDATTPSKSNLTRTGQMLDSIGVTNVRDGEVSVGPKGKRRDGRDNSEIADAVSERGRPFNNFSKLEKKQVADMIRKDFQAAIQRQLTKRK